MQPFWNLCKNSISSGLKPLSIKEARKLGKKNGQIEWNLPKICKPSQTHHKGVDQSMKFVVLNVLR